MSQDLNSKRMLCISSGLAGVIGVVLLGLSFAINAGPPPNATSAELMKFGHDNYANILWGAWMQACSGSGYTFCSADRSLRGPDSFRGFRGH